MKTLDSIEIDSTERRVGQEIRFRLSAKSFLHNQVRSIIGSLDRVGAGTWTPDDIKVALEARERQACGPVAPSEGLYLSDVSYDDDIF